MTATNTEPSLEQILAEDAAEEQAWIDYLRRHGEPTTSFERDLVFNECRAAHVTFIPPGLPRAA